MKTQSVKVAISADFLSAFSRIPKAQQGKVMRFVEEFKRNPQSSGINYEKIRGGKDSKFRSVRIDLAYRGIVIKPDQGNVYVLLWVDNHDDAYKWAEKRMCKINPETGSLQIFSVDEYVAEEQKNKKDLKNKGLFDGLRTKQLLRLGVPEELINIVTNIKTDEDLEQKEPMFPQEAYEALYMLAAGFSVEEVFMEMDKKDEEINVDIANYDEALNNPDSQRRFYVVADELELEAILNAPLDKWRVFLHPSQRKLVTRDWNGPVRVLGGAGTGKTVVALHRAKWLAENRAIEKFDKILFTTFTSNLAEDIKCNLRKICAPEIFRKIEVINLDQWVSNCLKKQGYKFKIDYGRESKKCWENALTLQSADTGLSEDFYREEWEKVIQANGIETLNDYMTISRVGRGTKLNRKLRKDIWKIFEEYRTQLNENGIKEREDAIRDCRELLDQKGDDYSYISIIVDEAQDMGMEAFKLIRQIISQEKINDIFIVGDGHQKIYRHKVVLSQCGVNIRGRSKKLRINYRTTDEIRKWSVRLLENITIDDLDGEKDELKGYKSLLHGINPVIKECKTFDKEISYLCSLLKERTAIEAAAQNDICIVVRTNKLIGQYKLALADQGIETYLLKRSETEDRSTPGVRLSTMHRIKGLEFETIIMAGINDGIIPLELATLKTDDPMVRAEYEQIERSLVYVAATRAKKELFITSYGNRSKWIKK